MSIRLKPAKVDTFSCFSIRAHVCVPSISAIKKAFFKSIKQNENDGDMTKRKRLKYASFHGRYTVVETIKSNQRKNHNDKDGHYK